MTVEEVRPYVDERPFRPFRLVLDSGEQITVRKPQKALLSGQTLAVVGVSRLRPKGAGIEKLRLVRVDRAISAERVTADKA